MMQRLRDPDLFLHSYLTSETEINEGYKKLSDPDDI